jgi:hypothetical protein
LLSALPAGRTQGRFLPAFVLPKRLINQCLRRLSFRCWLQHIPVREVNLNPILQKKRFVVLGLIVLSMVTGCALTHPTKPFQPPKTHRWDLSEEPPAPPPLSLPAGPLDLPQAIRIALANNPDIAAAGWDEKSAQARYDAAFGERLPSLKAVGG